MPNVKPKSAFRYPLGSLLGSQGAVRIARELFRHGGMLSGPELAGRTSMTRAGANATLRALTDSGLVRHVGGGRASLYQIAAEHPLAPVIGALFDAEEAHVQRCYDMVRTAASGVSPRPQALWLFGSVARGDDHPGSDFDVAVVAPNNRVEKTVDAVRDAIRAAAERLFLRISVIGVSPEDLDRMASAADPFWTALRRDAKTLVGPEPDDLLRAYRKGLQTRG